ncbi:MAG: uL13 family ribosomal protein, partial [Acidobacteriota bacterium]
GYPGGLRERTLKDQMKRDSRLVMREAIFGMLPKNSLRTKRLRHLRLYKSTEHPHAAQLAAASTPSGIK